MEVITAEFLPFEKQLHMIVADADMNLQVLQFDPESLSFPLQTKTMRIDGGS
jgi:hypothetical protein